MKGLAQRSWPREHVRLWQRDCTKRTYVTKGSCVHLNFFHERGKRHRVGAPKVHEREVSAGEALARV